LVLLYDFCIDRDDFIRELALLFSVEVVEIREFFF